MLGSSRTEFGTQFPLILKIGEAFPLTWGASSAQIHSKDAKKKLEKATQSSKLIAKEKSHLLSFFMFDVDKAKGGKGRQLKLSFHSLLCNSQIDSLNWSNL